jgi:hypothetical protein
LESLPESAIHANPPAAAATPPTPDGARENQSIADHAARITRHNPNRFGSFGLFMTSNVGAFEL